MHVTSFLVIVENKLIVFAILLFSYEKYFSTIQIPLPSYSLVRTKWTKTQAIAIPLRYNNSKRKYSK